MLLLVLNVSATDYYFSNTGSDSNGGHSTGDAWQTLTKLNTVSYAAGDHLYFNRGNVFSGEITCRGTGTAGSHIYYGAYGTGANPVISGLTTLSSWTDNGSGIYYTTVDMTRLNMVTLNGVVKAMGRYPDNGWLNYESNSGNTSITDNQLTGTPNWTGAEIGIRKYRWIIDRHVVTNQTGSVLTYSALSDYGSNTSLPQDGNGYFFQNDIKCLDDLGDWYYDVAAKRLYMYFGVLPSGYTVKASTQVHNVSLNAKSYTDFENIDFEGGNYYGIRNIGGCHYLTFTNCNFTAQGGNAFYGTNSDHITITNCSITDAFNDGVMFEGAVTEVTIDGLTTSHCGDMLGTSRSGDAAGVAIYVDGNNAIIRNCSVVNSGYHGIYFNGNNALVENNFVDSYCIVKDDGGGIYTYISTGSTIQNNIVVNGIGSYAGAESNSWEPYGKAAAIYIDDGVASHTATITGNTLSTSEWAGIFIHDSSGDIITNNTVFNFASQLLFLESVIGTIRTTTVTGNKFIAKAATQRCWDNLMYVSENPSLFGTFDNNYYARPIDDNQVFYTTFNGDTYTTKSLSEWKTYTGDDVSSLGSPFSISNVSELSLVYNKTSSSASSSLTGIWKNLSGTQYDESITLSPFASSVLFYVGEHQTPTSRTKGISAGNGKAWGVNGISFGY